MFHSLWFRRFGFPNRQALEAGRTGTDCRGEEHEIVVVWSIASGKRQILMDGKEIHYSATRISILDHSWSSKGNHVLKVICHAAPPMSVPHGFRQYDLLIDGQSFFTMPKVFELGIKSTGDRVPGIRSADDYNGQYNTSAMEYGVGGGYDAPSIRAPRTTEEEEAALQLAIRASLADSKKHLGETEQNSKPTTSEPPPMSDLLDLGGTGGPPALMPDPMMAPLNTSNSSVGAPSYGYDSYGAAPPQQQYQQPPAPPTQYGQYGAPPPSHHGQYGAPPPSQYGQYGAPPQQQSSFLALPSSQPTQGGGYAAPPGQSSSVGYGGGYPSGLSNDPFSGPNDDPFAPKPPTHNQIADDILKAYSSSDSGPQYQPGLPFSPQSNGYGHTENDQSNPGGATLSLNALSISEKAPEKPKSALEEAMSKLVNLDHIDEPAEEQLKLTMKQEEEKKKNEKKSKPLPPAAKGMVGSAATLSQIQEVKPAAPPKKLTVKPPPSLFNGDPAMAGALVLHSSALSTPPPLQPRGIGVVHMQGQYPSVPVGSSAGGFGVVYQMQQQQQMMMQQQQMQQQYQPQPPMMQTGYGQPPPQPMQYQQPPPAGYGSSGWR